MGSGADGGGEGGEGVPAGRWSSAKKKNPSGGGQLFSYSPRTLIGSDRPHAPTHAHPPSHTHAHAFHTHAQGGTGRQTGGGKRKSAPVNKSIFQGQTASVKILCWLGAGWGALGGVLPHYRRHFLFRRRTSCRQLLFCFFVFLLTLSEQNGENVDEQR